MGIGWSEEGTRRKADLSLDGTRLSLLELPGQRLQLLLIGCFAMGYD